MQLALSSSPSIASLRQGEWADSAALITATDSWSEALQMYWMAELDVSLSLAPSVAGSRMAQKQMDATAEPAKNPPSPKSRLAMLKRTKKASNATSDPFRFQNSGIIYKGKLIGEQDVDKARGDSMCAEAMRAAKAIVKAAGAHKTRISLQINIEGIKILDEKSGAVLHNFPVSRISFIARDTTDARAFGLIYGDTEGKYKFYGIKTAQSADQAVLAIRDMFQVVFEMKKKHIEQVKQQQATNSESGDSKQDAVAVADLLDLESELQQIEQGVQQLSTVPTSTDAFGASPFGDPFADSFASNSTMNNSSMMNGSMLNGSGAQFNAFSSPHPQNHNSSWMQASAFPPVPQPHPQSNFDSSWGHPISQQPIHHVHSTPTFHTNAFSDTNPFASSMLPPQQAPHTAAPLLMAHPLADPFGTRAPPALPQAAPSVDWANENTAPASQMHHANTFANFGDNKPASNNWEEKKVTSLEEAFSKLVDMDALVGRGNDTKKNPFDHILNPPKASLNTLSATSCSAAASTTHKVATTTADPFGDDFFR
ncbi:unnamed protein product [Caenorhabditis auriculariae]|uniref:PID domain-containing protein n=1 Tax=Caenorhabditis auriculariae TaxID=2777116 RepID=A0A8S1HV61_9PELO|nr:unnamed protein product [Caenorhabditis auriculariae]